MLSNQFPIKSVNAILAGEVGLGMGTEQRVFFNLGDGETYSTEARVKEYLSRWDIKFTYHGYGEYTTMKSTSQIIELLEGDNYITISATTKGIKDILSLKYKDGIFAGLEDIPTKVSELEYDVVDVDTWRPIRVNGSYILSRITTSSPLNFVNGNNTTITHTGNGDVTFSSNDTYERNRYSGQIKAGAAVTAGNIIVAKDGAYHNLKDGTAFDITFPILYASQNIISGNFNTQTYDQYLMVINATQSMTLERLPVYIKGTLVGTVFTPVSTTPLTQVEPTTEDGYDYILLGCAISTNGLYLQAHHPIYSYKNGAFSENTKVESSTINGNIKINGTETVVYDDSELQDIVSTDEVTIEGNPLNFNTLSSQNAKSTILSVEPIQDLHGYDKPWVGGAGKNLLPMTVNGIKAVNTTGTWSGNVFTPTGQSGTFTILVDADNNVNDIKMNGTFTSAIAFYLYAKYESPFPFTSTNYILNGCPNGGGSNTYKLDCIYRVGGNDNVLAVDTGSSGQGNFSVLSSATQIQFRIVVYSGTYSNVTFYPMLRLSTESDTTFQPYTNECGISGRTQIGILGCGGNLIPDGTNTSNGYKDNYYLYSYGDQYNENYYISEYFRIKPNTNYRYTVTGTATNPSIAFYDSNKNELECLRIGDVKNNVITTPNNAVFARASQRKNSEPFYQFEEGSISTEYTPYVESNDLTISLGQTVYGGTLDVENGVLVVDKGYAEFNGLSSNNWTYVRDYGTVSRFDYSSISGKSGGGEIISNLFEGGNGIAVIDNTEHVYLHGNYGTLIVCVLTSRLSTKDVTGFMSWLTNNNLSICYELAEPITINLTPHTINLLKGVNNISVDDENATISLTYRDGKVATLGDLTSAVDELDGKIEDSKILTDTVTGDKYILVVTNGVLSVEQISN